MHAEKKNSAARWLVESYKTYFCPLSLNTSVSWSTLRLLYSNYKVTPESEVGISESNTLSRLTSRRAIELYLKILFQNIFWIFIKVCVFLFLLEFIYLCIQMTNVSLNNYKILSKKEALNFSIRVITKFYVIQEITLLIIYNILLN